MSGKVWKNEHAQEMAGNLLILSANIVHQTTALIDNAPQEIEHIRNLCADFSAQGASYIDALGHGPDMGRIERALRAALDVLMENESESEGPDA